MLRLHSVMEMVVMGGKGVGGGKGGSYRVFRVVFHVDLSTICDEYLCDLKITIIAGNVERCVLVLTEAGVEYDAEGWP